MLIYTGPITLNVTYIGVEVLVYSQIAQSLLFLVGSEWVGFHELDSFNVDTKSVSIAYYKATIDFNTYWVRKMPGLVELYKGHNLFGYFPSFTKAKKRVEQLEGTLELLAKVTYRG